MVSSGHPPQSALRNWSRATSTALNQDITPPLRAKRSISIRLNPDIIEFFKKDGAHYQSRINAVLRVREFPAELTDFGIEVEHTPALRAVPTPSVLNVRPRRD